MYLVEVNADSSLPILTEIYQKFSMLSIETLKKRSRLCGICWLCLIAILKKSNLVSPSVIFVDVESRALTVSLRSKLRGRVVKNDFEISRLDLSVGASVILSERFSGLANHHVLLVPGAMC